MILKSPRSFLSRRCLSLVIDPLVSLWMSFCSSSVTYWTWATQECDNPWTNSWSLRAHSEATMSAERMHSLWETDGASSWGCALGDSSDRRCRCQETDWPFSKAIASRESQEWLPDHAKLCPSKGWASHHPSPYAHHPHDLPLSQLVWSHSPFLPPFWLHHILCWRH